MKRTRIKPVSDKRRAVNVERRRMLEQTFGKRESWRCSLRDTPSALAAFGACFGEVNGHEVLKRSQGGSIVDPENIVLLCNHHNSQVEMFPVEAHKFGLMRHVWEI